MTPAEAKTKLLRDPDHFIKYYPLQIAGSNGAVNTAVRAQYFLDKRDANNPIAGRTLGHEGATRPGLFGHQRQISSFTFQTAALRPGTSVACDAHVIPMVKVSAPAGGLHGLNGDLTAMPHFVVDGAGDGILLTGQLSGCSFAWSVHGGTFRAIHIQPDATINGGTLRVQLANRGAFAANPGQPLQVFGSPDYPGSYAVVIGVRAGGAWRLYAQTTMDQGRTITGARRLHPAPQVL